MNDTEFDAVLLEIERHPGLYGAIGPRVLAGVAALREQLTAWKELHRVIAEELTEGLGWPDHGNAPLAIAATFMLYKQRLEKAEADNAALQPLLTALRHIDWVQIILNQSAPCCFIEDEDGRFCGRAERWAGHEHFHKFTSLDAAIDAAMREGKET